MTRPNDMTLITWSMGRTLVWDATCVDIPSHTIIASSHLQNFSKRVSLGNDLAKRIKHLKYSFEIESLGPWVPNGLSLYKTINKNFMDRLGDPRAGSCLALLGIIIRLLGTHIRPTNVAFIVFIYSFIVL